jgi:hypothetical protein
MAGNPNIAEIGRPTRFKPGQVANPRGRPPDRLLAELKRRMTAEQAKRLVTELLTQAEAGDLKALEMVWDRLGGRPVARNEQGEPGAFERQVIELEVVRDPSETSGETDARDAV